MKLKLMNLIIMLIAALLSIAFFTLMERKLISFMQNRKGPNKTSISGIIQPISDAIKLLGKEMNMNTKSNFLMFILSPGLNLTCSLAMWMVFPFVFSQNFMKMSTLFIMSCMAMNMIALMAMSWSSNSNYSFIGMMRTISQMISYEINLIFTIIIMMNLTNQASLSMMSTAQKYLPVLVVLPITLTWIITMLGETNRTPFDFAEGESELVSGFNIEYGGSAFVMLFLSEYSSILMMSMISNLMFTGLKPTEVAFYLMYTITCSFFIWSRATFPRFRYDKLMKINWTQILPLNTYILYWSFLYKIYWATKS